MSVNIYKYGRVSGYPGLIVCLNCWIDIPYEKYNWHVGQHSGYIQILDIRNYPIELTKGEYFTHDGIMHRENITYNGYTHVEVVIHSEYHEPVFPTVDDILDEDCGDLEDISWEIYYNRETVLKILFHQLRRFLDYYLVMFRDFQIPIIPIDVDREHYFVILDTDGSRKYVEHNGDLRRHYEPTVTVNGKTLAPEEYEQYRHKEFADRNAEFKTRFEKGYFPSLSDLMFIRARQQCFSGHYRECVITLYTAFECMLTEIYKNAAPHLSDNQVRTMLRKYTFVNRFTKLMRSIFQKGINDIPSNVVYDDAPRDLLDDVKLLSSLRNFVVHQGLDINVDEAWEVIFCGDRIREAVRAICGMPYKKLVTISRQDF